MGIPSLSVPCWVSDTPPSAFHVAFADIPHLSWFLCPCGLFSSLEKLFVSLMGVGYKVEKILCLCLSRTWDFSR
jgi:hypothetical protein